MINLFRKKHHHSQEIYVHQVSGYAIGNFINCTPAIKALADYFKSPIDVVFDSKIVSQMYEKCDFINEVKPTPALEKRDCVIRSDMVNGLIADWRYIYNKTAKHYTKTLPHTYVDHYHKQQSQQKTVVILRGMVNYTPYWVDKKDPGDTIYSYILNKIPASYKIIYPYGQQDYDHHGQAFETIRPGTIILNDIKQSLAYINDADFVIANDTGLYHAAAALKKPCFVLWKKTLLRKNKAPGKSCFYSKEKNWQKEFDQWLNSILT
jgi:ADP-heptose:LPS heptosyltransferase